MNEIFFILYVADQDRSRQFYKGVFQMEPILDVPGMTEFRIDDNCLLGLMTENAISSILGNSIHHPRTGNGIPRCELYIFVDDPEAYYKRLVSENGSGIRRPEKMAWGDFVAYGADPDGHILAFARKGE